MSRTRILYPLAAALAATLALSACKKSEPAPPPAPAATAPAPAPLEAPAASASVVSVDLGNSVGADKRVVAPTTTFAPNDTVYASVATRTSDAAATVAGKLAAKWTYQDGQTVNEESHDLNFTGEGANVFQVSLASGLPAGQYKLEVSLDGTVVQSKDFEVKQ